jgi:predicted nucleic acid-binding protein
VAVRGWLLDKSAGVRAKDPIIGAQLDALVSTLHICPVIELERLYSARSVKDYEEFREDLHGSLIIVSAPTDIFDRALRLQRDLAHHHGLWHRIPISDLLIAETALFHDLGIVHVDRDFERIAEVRPLITRRLG